MSEIQNAIEVKNLKKGFGGRVLFENFSLNVKANTIHAIIGPNGSGKTTLLRLITGVYQLQGQSTLQGNMQCSLKMTICMKNRLVLKI